MKKTTTLFIIVVLCLMNSSLVLGAKKTMTKYTWDDTVGAVVTDPSSWRLPGTNYAIYASTGTVNLNSYTTIVGNIYAKTVTTASGVTIKGNIIAQSVTLESGTKVTGSICASSGDVVLKSQGTIVTGEIDAWGNVTLGASCEAQDKVYASGAVTLNSSGSKVYKDIHAGGDVLIDMSYAQSNVYSGGAVKLTDGGATVTSDVHAAGSVKVGYSSKISGSVWAGGSITNNGTITGTKLTGQSAPPRINPTSPITCTSVTTPKTQTYTAGGSDVTLTQGTSKTLTPGTYGVVTFAYNSTLTLKAGTCSSASDSGCYYFTKFTGGSDSLQTLRLDFSTGSQITVFSVGDIVWSGPIQVSTNGSTWTSIQTLYESSVTSTEALAQKVYWETHGALTLTSNGSPRQWFGTTLASGSITVPDNFFIVGALATVSGSITSNTTSDSIHYVLADFARTNW